VARWQSPARRLAWAVAAFVLLQAGLGLAVEREWVGLRDPLYARKAGLLRARLDRPAAERSFVVVALGSSRTAFGLDSARLTGQLTRDLGRPVEVFNFGIPAAGPMTERLYLERLLADGLRPDLLLVEVFAPFLMHDHECFGRQTEEDWLLPVRLRPDEVPVANRYGFHVPAPGRCAGLVPWHTFRCAVLSALVPGWLPGQARLDGGHACDPCGGPAEGIDDISPELAAHGLEIARRQYAYLLGSGSVSRSGEAALTDLVGLCRANGVPAAVVLMPESRQFRSWYSPAARAELGRFTEELARGTGERLIDAAAWVPDGMFSDGHHLRPSGAAVFSDRLGREALGPLVRRLERPAED
jgi:hypothetical protein